MAEETKHQLTEEEKIERKARIFRIISRILIVAAVIIIGIFIYFAYGTKQNISEQTAIDTQELRSKLKQIIALENRYYEEHGEYVSFKFLALCKELTNYDPAVDGNFKYMFDAKTGIATGREQDASRDVNGDNDGTDGLTLDVKWNAGVSRGSSGGNFFWTEEDLADFKKRADSTN